MRNIAVLVQIIGLILSFTIGVAGYILGPSLIIIGGIWYRKESKKIKNTINLQTEYPIEIDRWNWAAFFFNWIWGIGNNVFIALLCLVPFVNLVFIFILGAKGNRWAWQNGNWDSVEQFQATQRKWALWIIPVYTGILLLVVGLVFGISSMMKSSDAYKLGLESALRNSITKEIVGEPVEIGLFTQGSIQIQGVMGTAELSIPISGPKASGKVYVNAIKKRGRWELNELYLVLDNGSEAINLIE